MIYFLSDAHIGSRAFEDRATHQFHVVELLHHLSQDATAIYLLGDIFDYWYEYLWQDASKKEYEPVLKTLRELTDKGIEVHFFTGNHDIWTFGQLAQWTGVKVHTEPLECEIAGKSFYLAHGDGLVPRDYIGQFSAAMQRKIRRFMQLRRLFHNPLAQRLFRLVPPAWGNTLGYGWARNSRLKEMAHPCGYKGENQEELVLFAKEQEALGHHHDYYIFGHRHIELDLMLSSSSRLLILGDCFQQWTYVRCTVHDARCTMMNFEYE